MGSVLSIWITFSKYDIPHRRLHLFHSLDLKLCQRRNQADRCILAATSNLVFFRSDVTLSNDSVAWDSWLRYLSLWDNISVPETHNMLRGVWIK